MWALLICRGCFVLFVCFEPGLDIQRNPASIKKKIEIKKFACHVRNTELLLTLRDRQYCSC